jgi:hypothetical protein
MKPSKNFHFFHEKSVVTFFIIEKSRFTFFMKKVFVMKKVVKKVAPKSVYCKIFRTKKNFFLRVFFLDGDSKQEVCVRGHSPSGQRVQSRACQCVEKAWCVAGRFSCHQQRNAFLCVSIDFVRPRGGNRPRRSALVQREEERSPWSSHGRAMGHRLRSNFGVRGKM